MYIHGFYPHKSSQAKDLPNIKLIFYSFFVEAIIYSLLAYVYNKLMCVLWEIDMHVSVYPTYCNPFYVSRPFFAFLF